MELSQFKFLKPVPLMGKVRFGPKVDGGYVVYSTALAYSEMLVTFGVGWDCEFEMSFNSATGLPVRMFDHTMYGKQYIIRTDILANYLRRYKYKLALTYVRKILSWYCKIKLLQKDNIEFINKGVASIKSENADTLEFHLERDSIRGKRIILKIDIEGTEYDIIEAIYSSKLYEHIDQIIVEWHNIKTNYHRLRNLIVNLNKNFIIAHIHGNNYGGTFEIRNAQLGESYQFPNVLEMLLVNKLSVFSKDLKSHNQEYPSPLLDCPNNPALPDIDLSFM